MTLLRLGKANKLPIGFLLHARHTESELSSALASCVGPLCSRLSQCCFFGVGRLPYASGAEWQGWVRLELQDQTYLPCIGTLFYLPRHNGAPRFAPRRCQDNLMCVLFIGHFFELLLLRLVDQTAL